MHGNDDYALRQLCHDDGVRPTFENTQTHLKCGYLPRLGQNHCFTTKNIILDPNLAFTTVKLQCRIPKLLLYYVATAQPQPGCGPGHGYGPWEFPWDVPWDAHGNSHGKSHGTFHGTSYGTSHGTSHGNSHGMSHGTSHGTSHGNSHGTSQGRPMGRPMGIPKGVP